MKRPSIKRPTAFAAALLALGLAATGCLQNPDEAGSGGGLNGFVDGGSSDGDGEVTIFGTFGGGEEAAFNESLRAFEEESGLQVEYTSDKDMPTAIKQKANAGDTPDIALFPQPGGLLELAADGYIQPIDTYLDYDALNKTLVPGILDAARLNGRTYGAPMRMAVKSLVFYPKQAYEQAGYPTAPASIEEIDRIGQEIKQSGASPWCMGWQDAQNTGWVGTDWIEELVLRVHGPELYDEWVAHDIPFNDERIVQVFDTFRDMVLASGQTYGGARGILNTPFGESFNAAFDNPPKCFLHRQGNFITGFLPDAIQENLDSEVGLFVYPPSEEGYQGQPILGGGDIAALFNGNDDEAIEVMRFLTSDQFGSEWAAAGGWLSPHTTFDANNYPDTMTKAIAEIVSQADVFRFDASDLMPKEIGSDAFWTGMIDFVNGASSQEATTAIENAWPTE